MPNTTSNPYQSPNSSGHTKMELPEGTEVAELGVAGQIRIIQIIVLTLMGGLTAYSLVVWFQQPTAKIPPPPALSQVVMLVGATILALTVGVALEFTDIGMGRVVPTQDATPGIAPKVLAACGILNSRTILSNAIREGAGFYCLFVFSTTRNLIVSVLFLILVLSMILSFPTRSRFLAKLRRILERS
jgi:hypothetical protein